MLRDIAVRKFATAVAALVCASSALGGCHSYRHHAPQRPPVHLASKTPFLVYWGAPTRATRQRTCHALHVTGEVQALRGDTIVFADIRIRRRPARSAPCELTGSAYVVTSETPGLRAITGHVDVGGTIVGLLILSAPIVFLAVILGG